MSSLGFEIRVPDNNDTSRRNPNISCSPTILDHIQVSASIIQGTNGLQIGIAALDEPVDEAFNKNNHYRQHSCNACFCEASQAREHCN